MKNSLIIILSSLLFSQTEPIENLRENSPRVWTLTNAMIHTSPGNFIKGGSISIRNGKIEAVGRYIKTPKDAVKMTQFADGVVIGSVLIDKIKKVSKDLSGIKDISSFLNRFTSKF